MNRDALAERRRRPRVRLTYSLRLRRPGEASLTETRTEDISCEGFFCVTDRSFCSGETLQCELVIPSEQQGQAVVQEMILRCRADVVRVVPRDDYTGFGIACRVADYTITDWASRQSLELFLMRYST